MAGRRSCSEDRYPNADSRRINQLRLGIDHLERVLERLEIVRALHRLGVKYILRMYSLGLALRTALGVRIMYSLSSRWIMNGSHARPALHPDRP